MRRTWITGPGWIVKNDTVIGIALGSDACAEHEFGIRPIQQAFGLQSEKLGIEKRIATKIPDHRNFFDDNGVSALVLLPKYLRSEDLTVQDIKNHHELRRYSKNERLITAWDDKSFAIVAYGPSSSEDRIRLREDLLEAFNRKDLAIWIEIGAFHSGKGLILAIASRIPEEDKNRMLNHDLDVEQLTTFAKATEIEKKLKNAGKSWFDLSPKWAASFKGSKKLNTAHPVLFWLNPMEQRKYHHGYFTVEELEEWTKDKGPVVKNEEEPNG